MPENQKARPTVDRLSATEFESLRRYLFSIAYRLTGSASEAEDVVQDAWLRMQNTSTSGIQSLKAYLATVVTRQSLDVLRSSKHQREVYVGPWLPEPVLTSELVSAPSTDVERDDDVSLAFLVLLERLTPEERAAYVLREAFDYPYDDIAEVLNKTAPAVRQLSHRARKHVESGRQRFPVSTSDQRRLSEAFLHATRTGELEGLRHLLTESATAWADGGAKTQAARRPLHGSDNISRWLVAIAGLGLSAAPMTIEEINGAFAGIFWESTQVRLVIVPEVGEHGIANLRIIRNPDKLAHLQRQFDARN
jgi:RNA polymerase sigma-70 factor (ECF subfamily)